MPIRGTDRKSLQTMRRRRWISPKRVIHIPWMTCGRKIMLIWTKIRRIGTLIKRVPKIAFTCCRSSMHPMTLGCKNESIGRSLRTNHLRRYWASDRRSTSIGCISIGDCRIRQRTANGINTTTNTSIQGLLSSLLLRSTNTHSRKEETTTDQD